MAEYKTTTQHQAEQITAALAEILAPEVCACLTPETRDRACRRAAAAVLASLEVESLDRGERVELTHLLNLRHTLWPSTATAADLLGGIK